MNGSHPHTNGTGPTSSNTQPAPLDALAMAESAIGIDRRKWIDAFGQDRNGPHAWAIQHADQLIELAQAQALTRIADALERIGGAPDDNPNDHR